MSEKYKHIFMLLLLPALILFDVGIYLLTRATCFECHGVGEFIQNGSLASSVVMDAVRIMKNK
jgi:hypothetical protein